MAARIRKIRHDEETRAKIQASQLINRLQAYALSVPEKEGSAYTPDLSQGQLKAIEILLKKTLPDLSAAELTGADGEAIEIAQVQRVIVDAMIPKDTGISIVKNGHAPNSNGSGV